MVLLDNPVLHRELLVNLRRARAFVVLFVYIALLSAVVVAAWPDKAGIDAGVAAGRDAQPLVRWFFLGQYILLTLIAPTLAAGAVSGEKERKTYEMLLASPMRPGAIVLGKLLAAVGYLALLVFASLPVVLLCLPLGGVSPQEVLASYVGMAASVATFGMISMAASSFFTRTAAALVVSYLAVLPVAVAGGLLEILCQGRTRVVVVGMVFPAMCLAACFLLFFLVHRRLCEPPEIDVEAEAMDPDKEQTTASGMVIQRHRFPDNLLAPAKRTDCLDEKANPVYNKEIRSELFGPSTLFLRLAIQISIGLAFPLMAACLYFRSAWAAWYVDYVLVFSVLVGPVFSAAAISGERERQTLELLLTTTLTPWQIISGKLRAILRVACVLTAFVAWPLVLACLLPPWPYWHDTLTMLGYLAIIGATTVTTTLVGMFCSSVFHRTMVSLVATYLVLLTLFFGPIAVRGIQAASIGVSAKIGSKSVARVVPAGASPFGSLRPAEPSQPASIQILAVASPITAAHSLPLTLGRADLKLATASAWWTPTAIGFLEFSIVFDVGLLTGTLWLMRRRWRLLT